MPYTDTSDEEVAHNALKDKGLFVVLVERYESALDRYIRRLGIARKEDREDVLQDVFLKIYRNLNGFDPKLKFSSWAYRIAHNEAVSFFRKKQKRPEFFPDEESDVITHAPGTLDSERIVNQSIDADRLRNALALLDQKYRDVLVLRFFEERDYTDISDVLKIPMGTVATLLHRAKKQLKHVLDHKQ